MDELGKRGAWGLILSKNNYLYLGFVIAGNGRNSLSIKAQIQTKKYIEQKIKEKNLEINSIKDYYSGDDIMPMIERRKNGKFSKLPEFWFLFDK